MDVDEFLNKEFPNFGSQTDKTEEFENITESPQFKEDSELPSLFEDIKASLSSGNLEKAEQSYIRLWRILLRQKTKWNNELYEQLSILSRQFSIALAHAYNEAKRRAEHIYKLINKARAFLREGKKDISFKFYSEIEKINNSIPNVFFEEKRIIQEQIMNFYKELKSATDNELIRRVSSMVQEINQLINKINISIRANDITNAIENYNRCIQLYDQLPEGFLMHKNLIGIRILDIYKNLSIHAEISNLQKNLLSIKKEQAKMPIEKSFYSEPPKGTISSTNTPNKK